jgi:CheY-like chemotaxis protein
MPSESHKRVLVVDDDEGVRQLISTILRQYSLRVDEASDGAQALALLEKNEYSVVLLDLLMPVASGFDVLEHFRVADAAHSPVVLVITGAERSRVDALDPRSIHGIIRKPFDPEELASLVAACADIRGRGFSAIALATIVLTAWTSIGGSAT